MAPAPKGLLSPAKARIFRITHVRNVPWLLTHGIHCRSAKQVDPAFIQIGNPELIQKRKSREVPIPPRGTLSDYVPFYFTPFSPMLYNIKTGYNGIAQRSMEDIVILCSSLPRLDEHEVRYVYSDRHAYLALARFHSSMDGIGDILQQRDFQRDPDDPGKMDRYQAEALVHRHVPCAALTGIVCCDTSVKAKLERLVAKAGLDLTVVNRPQYYI